MNRFSLLVGSGLLVVLTAGITKTAEVKPPPERIPQTGRRSRLTFVLIWTFP
jgi:hypothetical protein